MQQSTGDLRSFISLPVLIGHIDYRYAACLTSGFDSGLTVGKGGCWGHTFPFDESSVSSLAGTTLKSCSCKYMPVRPTCVQVSLLTGDLANACGLGSVHNLVAASARPEFW
jgi:hypothetical protein